MSYERLMELTSSPAGAALNVEEVLNEINEEMKEANTEEKRGALLDLFNSTMNIVESTLAADDLHAFKESRTKHYYSYLIQESLIGSDVCSETLLAVTTREIAAGRMKEDEGLREAAVSACSAPHMTRAELATRAKHEKEPSIMFRVRKFFGNAWGQ